MIKQIMNFFRPIQVTKKTRVRVVQGGNNINISSTGDVTVTVKKLRPAGGGDKIRKMLNKQPKWKMFSLLTARGDEEFLPTGHKDCLTLDQMDEVRELRGMQLDPNPDTPLFDLANYKGIVKSIYSPIHLSRLEQKVPKERAKRITTQLANLVDLTPRH